MGKEGMKLMQTYQDSLETMNHEAVEYIRGISVLKSFWTDGTIYYKVQ